MKIILNFLKGIFTKKKEESVKIDLIESSPKTEAKAELKDVQVTKEIEARFTEVAEEKKVTAKEIKSSVKKVEASTKDGEKEIKTPRKKTSTRKKKEEPKK